MQFVPECCLAIEYTQYKMVVLETVLVCLLIYCEASLWTRKCCMQLIASHDKKDCDGKTNVCKRELPGWLDTVMVIQLLADIPIIKYGRQQLSRPMRIVGPIQFWRGCVIYGSAPKSGLGPRENASSVHTKVGTWSTRECWFGSLRKTSPFLGLYSRSRSRSNSGTHPCF